MTQTTAKIEDGMTEEQTAQVTEAPEAVEETTAVEVATEAEQPSDAAEEPTEAAEEEVPEGGEAPAGEETTQATKEPKKKPVLGVMVPLDPFVVNLSGTQGKRFLKVAVTLELSSPEVNAEVNENLQKIIDSILILLSSKTFENVYSIQGKFKLKDEITTRINRFLVLGHVKDAYFTEFVIQ